ncbi:MAG: DUF3530 family protein [Marinomonas sp.]|jgi:hypothetical protein
MRHKNKIKGFILLLFLFSFSAFAADEATGDETQTNEDAIETDNKTASKPLQERSFTPSQVKRIEALTRQLEMNAANEIENLSFQGDPFLALHKAAQTNDPQGCIILLHGNNEHPDWPNVISPVRSELTKSSWCTISIEVPDSLKKEALSFTPQEESEQTEDKTLLTHEEVVFGRIDASIDFANEKGISNISLLGYGTSATYALKYSASKQLNTGALILISASVPNQLAYFPFAELLKGSAQPVLDYYIRPNQFDKHYAQARRIAMLQRESQTPNYTQIKVTSNSQFSIDQKQLVQRIRGFLKQNTQQREQLKTLPEFSKSLFYQSP